MTERVMIRDCERHLHAHGMRDMVTAIAIGDFGTGFSSLSYLTLVESPQGRRRLIARHAVCANRANRGGGANRDVRPLRRDNRTAEESRRPDPTRESLAAEGCDSWPKLVVAGPCGWWAEEAFA